MADGLFQVPTPINEPVLGYLPGSPEKQALKTRLAELKADRVDIPLLIGGREVRTGRTKTIASPHDHAAVLGTWHAGDGASVAEAIAAAAKAKPAWEAMAWHDRAAIFLKAAELLATRHRATLNAATMLGQSKTVHQAEIDSACELIDFWRFNPAFMQQVYEQQPASGAGVWNRLDHRPLEGFLFAVTPFNFTSIAGNLPTACAMMGNTVIWKPASTAVYSGWFIMRLLREAGLPDGVINFVPGPGAAIGDPALDSPDLAGVHFTGSTGTFQAMWARIGAGIGRYRTYPRIVGETGGKDFIFVHASADHDEVAAAAVRGAFEYQGQKCSAASRMYVPKSLWKRLRQRLQDDLATIHPGDPTDFRTFMGAVIDQSAFRDISGFIQHVRTSADARLLAGGGCDPSRGWFIEPTLVEALDPGCKTMVEEIFGPVLTVYVYPDREYEQTLALCDRTSPYALTGAIFARDRAAVGLAVTTLRHAAGNFYINDKPTGAVVGQQPFGGARASGTNDKAGSALNLLRWTSPRAIKETFVPPTAYRYPFMSEE